MSLLPKDLQRKPVPFGWSFTMWSSCSPSHLSSSFYPCGHQFSLSSPTPFPRRAWGTPDLVLAAAWAVADSRCSSLPIFGWLLNVISKVTCLIAMLKGQLCSYTPVPTPWLIFAFTLGSVWPTLFSLLGFPGGSVVKNPAVNAGDVGSTPGSERFPWRREWQPTPVFLPRQRSFGGYSPQAHKELDTTEQLNTHVFYLLEKGMATHSRILAWRIPWTEEPGGLQSIGSHRVGYDWSDSIHTHTHTHFTYWFIVCPFFFLH